MIKIKTPQIGERCQRFLKNIKCFIEYKATANFKIIAVYRHIGYKKKSHFSFPQKDSFQKPFKSKMSSDTSKSLNGNPPIFK